MLQNRRTAAPSDHRTVAYLLPKKAYDGHQQGAFAAAEGTVDKHHGAHRLHACAMLVLKLVYVFQMSTGLDFGLLAAWLPNVEAGQRLTTTSGSGASHAAAARKAAACVGLRRFATIAACAAAASCVVHAPALPSATSAGGASPTANGTALPSGVPNAAAAYTGTACTSGQGTGWGF